MKEKIVKGVLTKENRATFLLGPNGEHLLEYELIWNGYTQHWLGKRVCARRLIQRDYERGRPIVLIWPEAHVSDVGYVELYYNERLVRHPGSILGHIAINVKGEVFNFSHRLKDNELMSEEEYFYRPALGEFAPHPRLGYLNISDEERPYYNNFGRIFMRTIHVLHIEGLDTERLSRMYHNELKSIHNTRVNPKKPEKYRDFNILTRSCTTIVRDGLRRLGYRKIRGISPRDFFVNTSYHLLKAQENEHIKMRCFKVKQLKVREAQYSEMTPLLNPINRFRQWKLSHDQR
ncbi:MAG: hypothetical protein SV775_10645 [Thermodesulfobacteriota bacterium]|nr:hypothetical protein [Thermodesulfobacteriota bacterium]